MNILSLDLDIFFPCHRYEKYIFYDIPPEKAWKVIDTLEIEYFPDGEKIYKVLELVKNIPLDKRVVITQHDEILEILKGLKDINLYNFDYHHDMGYKNFSYKINQGNWVLFAKEEKLIKNYYWIHTELSDPPIHIPFKYENYNILDNIEFPKFDMLIIVISPYYTPKQYWGLAKTFKEEV